MTGNEPGEFAEECRRQTALAAASDRADAGLMRLVDAALEDFGKPEDSRATSSPSSWR